ATPDTHTSFINIHKPLSSSSNQHLETGAALTRAQTIHTPYCLTSMSTHTHTHTDTHTLSHCYGRRWHHTTQEHDTHTPTHTHTHPHTHTLSLARIEKAGLTHTHTHTHSFSLLWKDPPL